MKMIKKLISVSLILTIALVMGALVDVEKADAGATDVQFTENTPIDIQDLVVAQGSEVVSMVVGTSTVTATLASGSNITFTSATGNIMELDHLSVATCVCNAGGDSYITVPYNATYPTVILSLTGNTCAGGGTPTIDSVLIESSTTIDVLFSENVTYTGTSDAATLAAATSFVGATSTLTPSTSSISGRTLTLTFAASALTGAGVKDDSTLSLPTAQVEATTGGADFAGTTSQVVTDLVSINQLYDFVFAIQEGQNFMSVPYDVLGPDGTAVSTAAKVALTYVSGASTISTYTIGDAGGDFATATSITPLYGYYINSDSASDVYLRLNKVAAASQSSSFERTFSAAGWHFIGVATNNVTQAVSGHLDDDVVSSLVVAGTAKYDRVVDMAIGTTGDTNAADLSGTYSYTYDATNSVYKSLLTDANIVTKTQTQIDANSVGIEFNHGEAYFVYITTANAVYIGEKVSTANLVR